MRVKGIEINIQNIDSNKYIGFDTVRMQAGLNSFTISPSKWIEITNAKGIFTKSGRYDSGTYAHEDIALEFASWISSEFKLYFIKEFRRFKIQENERLKVEWDVKRELVKINYRIHTDAIKENIPCEKRLLKLNTVAISQMKSLLNIPSQLPFI